RALDLFSASVGGIAAVLDDQAILVARRPVHERAAPRLTDADAIHAARHGVRKGLHEALFARDVRPAPRPGLRVAAHVAEREVRVLEETEPTDLTLLRDRPERLLRNPDVLR